MKEHLDFLVSQCDLEANHSILELLYRHRARIIIVYEPETLLYRYVVSPQVLSDLSEDSPLPLDSELLFYKSNELEKFSLT
jgi:hypothetical protein